MSVHVDHELAQTEGSPCVKTLAWLSPQPPNNPPCAASPCLIPAFLEPAMAYINRITDPEVAVASGELAPAQYLPGLPEFPSPDSDNSLKSCSPPLSLKEKSPGSLPYNLFLIPKGNQPVSFPKTKSLSRWGRFQLWFNTYR